ncbi:MAG: sulfur carrier protein ThiS adenylyltransferase ThiF [Desulfuromonadaceae bacterium]|nr:sulfur carrier protein ThiS adenylyltransferase ThiF [Desulfuromonadaceae bacterium]
MDLFVNEKPITTEEGLTLFDIRARIKGDADIIILNGFPCRENHPLQNGDRIVLIKRGEVPTFEELEALMTSRHTPGVHQRVKKARVGIAGVGGLGSSVAMALARTGVGKLVMADFDLVEPSNLNRQQYFADQIGLPKVAALRDNLERINPHIEVVIHHLRLAADNIPIVFEEVDVLIEAFDDADAKAMLIETFMRSFPEVPVVAASGVAGYGPSNTIVTRRTMGNLYLIGDGSTEAKPGQGLMAPRVGIAAHHQANAVLRLILGERPE